jgi:hypothetical protein
MTIRKRANDTPPKKEEEHPCRAIPLGNEDNSQSLSYKRRVSRRRSSILKSVSEHEFASLAKRETHQVKILRWLVLVLLLTTATLSAVGVYYFTKNLEKNNFEADYQVNALKIIESFQEHVARKLGAINSLATAITSYALDTQQNFPMVTIPNFAMRGSDLRVQADAVIIHWMPLVTNETRSAWEDYAFKHRFQIDEEFAEDKRQRTAQDAFFGMSEEETSGGKVGGSRRLEEKLKMTVDNQTGYHHKIWSNGAITPQGDVPDDARGPFLPLWQRSPINGQKQKMLNLDFANSKLFHGVLPALLETNEAILAKAEIPLPQFRDRIEKNLALGQYRHNKHEYLDDPLTFLAYPVFDSFAPDREFAGVLATNVYWKMFFANILPPSAIGYICVLHNSYNQTLSFRIDGSQAAYLGKTDSHDPHYDYLAESADVNAFVQAQAEPQTRSYTTVPLSRKYGTYSLYVYPSSDAEKQFTTNEPLIYTVVVVGVFSITCLLFLAYTCVVEKRQRIVMDRVVKSAAKTASAEREVNEFLTHEIRNPLAGSLMALTSCRQGVNETKCISDDAFKMSLQQDLQILHSSLHFIDEFLRSMLDVYRMSAGKLTIALEPADVLKDVLEPVCSILQQRDSQVLVTVECLPNLIIMTDSLRLKQSKHIFGTFTSASLALSLTVFFFFFFFFFLASLTGQL